MDKKLLIIEDDPYIMRALSSILEIEGYALDCVTTGADALSKARSDPPDLFLLDLGLPGGVIGVPVRPHLCQLI